MPGQWVLVVGAAVRARAKVIDMHIGVPREIKVHEYRVGLTPESVHELVEDGHKVMVEASAGLGIGANDGDYRLAGATIGPSREEVFESAEMIVKVKEPLAEERASLRPGQILFTFLHLAPDLEQANDLITSGATCIAYETVTDAQGGLPLLKPMSQVAGRMSVQIGAHCLEREAGGRGILLGGVPGVMPGKVVVIGGGVVGFNAAQMAVGLGADVTILDRNPAVLEQIENHFEARAKTRFSSRKNLTDSVADADMVVGAVLIAGAEAPKLVSREMVKMMKPGAVLVDVAIDQGGCFETSLPTTHAEPTFVVDDVVHYCVTNMPGAVPRTSTYALNNAVLPQVQAIASLGWRGALSCNQHLANGLNVWNGEIVHPAVAEALAVPPVALAKALQG